MNHATEELVRRHGERLQAVFPAAANMEPVALCRKLRRLEGEGERLALRLCNGPEFPYDEAELIQGRILDRLNALLNYRGADVPVFLNFDPRGYALKVDNEWTVAHRGALPTDWGGYGILAPDLTEGRD